MHLRRALLLFAIVLGLAALVAAVSRPVDPPRSPGRDAVQPPGAADPEPAREEVIRFAKGGRPARRVLQTGARATVRVAVDRPGQVELPGLGLSSPAEPRTPARFDVLADRPGSYDVTFLPAGSARRIARGTLVIRGPRP